MTFSIVACDLEEESWGVAVASKFPAVGAVVPWAQAGIGALATQSFANTSFGPRGLALMATGLSAQETLERLLEDDPDKELRQVGLVDRKGGSATFSGTGCLAWAGGDKRGRQSAAIYVTKPKAGYGGYLDRWLDYRVDDHEDPVPRLGELLEMHELYFGKSPEEDRVEIKGNLQAQIAEILIGEGYLKNGKEFGDAFNEFIGNENFEERADGQAGWIDAPVLKYLTRKFGGKTY